MAKEKRYPLILGFLLLGLLFFYLSYYYSGNFFKTPDFGSLVGQVKNQMGQVYVHRAKSSAKEKVTKKIPVYNLDSIETVDVGEADLESESSFVIRILDNSIITFEKSEDSESNSVVIYIKRGDIRILSKGREGELFIAKNGQRIPAEKYNESELKKLKAQGPVSIDESTESNETEKSLTEEEISANVNQHKSFFMKCFTKLLQKDPKAQGSATLNFTIENSGKMSLAEVSSLSIKDEEFKKCLKDVLSRITFRTFKGAPISTVFPIEFK